MGAPEDSGEGRERGRGTGKRERREEKRKETALQLMVKCMGRWQKVLCRSLVARRQFLLLPLKLLPALGFSLLAEKLGNIRTFPWSWKSQWCHLN